MAYTKIYLTKKTLSKAIDYVAKKTKTIYNVLSYVLEDLKTQDK